MEQTAVKIDKESLLKTEINYIKSDRIKKSCIKMVELLPDYFFEIAASSTGKYHPSYALGKGGLLRHTKAAVRIAIELLNDPLIGNKYTSNEKDLMIMGLILHDGLKLGIEKEAYTRFDHPLIMKDYIIANKDKLDLEEEEVTFLCDVIKTHMGVWTTDYNGNEVLEKPTTKYQNFVHMCDFLASRKCLLLPFDEDNEISA